MPAVETYGALQAAAAALLACALGWGCGGQAESQRAEPSFAAPSSAPTVPPPADSAPPRRVPTATAAPDEVPPSALRGPRRIDGSSAKAAAENVLLADCGPCHGPAAPVATSGGILFIGDLDRLVEAGLVVPLNSAGSRIIRVMVKGSMPPPGTRSLPVVESDINTVAAYIDNPRFWPSLTTPGLADGGTEMPAVDAGADGG